MIDNVKVTNTNGVMSKLVPLGNSTYSLLGFAPGSYVLDVIVDMPDSDNREAYETILLILKKGQHPVQPVDVINTVKVITDVKVTFEENDDDDKCSNKPGSAGMGFPYEKKTECEKQEWDQCIKDRENGIKWDDRCKDLNEGFFDDCEGYANKEECDEAWYTPPVDDSRRIVQPGCIEPNEQGECYIGMPGEKLPTPIVEARNQNQNQDNDNKDTDISKVEETEEWFN